MGVLAGVADMMGVESLLLLFLFSMVVAWIEILGAGRVDVPLVAETLVLSVVLAGNDLFEEDDARAFLGGVLVDLVVVSATGGSSTGSAAGALMLPVVDGDNGCSTDWRCALVASSFFLSCNPHSLARRLASSSLLFFEERGATASVVSPNSVSSSSSRFRLMVGGAIVGTCNSFC